MLKSIRQVTKTPSIQNTVQLDWYNNRRFESWFSFDNASNIHFKSETNTSRSKSFQTPGFSGKISFSGIISREKRHIFLNAHIHTLSRKKIVEKNITFLVWKCKKKEPKKVRWLTDITHHATRLPLVFSIFPLLFFFYPSTISLSLLDDFLSVSRSPFNVCCTFVVLPMYVLHFAIIISSQNITKTNNFFQQLRAPKKNFFTPHGFAPSQINHSHPPYHWFARMMQNDVFYQIKHSATRDVLRNERLLQYWRVEAF